MAVVKVLCRLVEHDSGATLKEAVAIAKGLNTTLKKVQ